MEKMALSIMLSDCIWIYRFNIRHSPCDDTTTTELLKQYTSQFVRDRQLQLNIKIEHNRFLFTIIFDKKNRYIAWTGNPEDRPILKN